jgi:ribosomal protein S1
MKWGAFASIVDDEAIEGLIHISEISEQRIAHPREVVQPSQAVTVRVIEVDGDNHRLALSLKQVDSDEFLEQDWGAMLETDVDETPTATALSAALSESGHDLGANPVTAEG